MSNPRELPILFNAAMVRAILAGTKTQTRRPISRLVRHGECKILLENGKWKDWWKVGDVWHSGRIYKPKYQIGDRLYVRETIQMGTKEERFYYSATNDARYPETAEERAWVWKQEIGKKIPSIHMPKILARIWLEVVDVRVERVNEISEADAMAEGIRKVSKDGELFKYCIYDHSDYSSVPWSEMPKSPRPVFETLWDSIYKNWDKNPWVFVYEFKVVQHG